MIAATNDAVIFAGKLWWEDGGSHTIDTTGSSSIQWRSGPSTFANAGTTVKVGIGAVDATTGPPVRAVNVTNVITFDVAAVFTGGGGGITTAAWQTSVPTTGTKTIANGDLIAISFQMTAKAGADSVGLSCENNLAIPNLPAVTQFSTSSYAATNGLPNVVVVSSGGVRGYIFGGFVATVAQTFQTWNNASGSKEYGNILRFPIPTRAYEIVTENSISGNCDFVLYGTPLGTPSALATVSALAVQTANQSLSSHTSFVFASPVDLAANTDYAVIANPSSATSVQMLYKTFADANHENSEWLGTDCYAVSRNTGAFAAQNSNKDRFAIGLLVGAFDAGGGGTTIYGVIGS